MTNDYLDTSDGPILTTSNAMALVYGTFKQDRAKIDAQQRDERYQDEADKILYEGHGTQAFWTAYERNCGQRPMENSSFILNVFASGDRWRRILQYHDDARKMKPLILCLQSQCRDQAVPTETFSRLLIMF